MIFWFLHHSLSPLLAFSVQDRGYHLFDLYPLFTLFPKSGSPKFFFPPKNHSMPISVNHYRDYSLPPVRDPVITTSSRAISPVPSPATDPPTLHTTFTGSVVGSISRRNRRSFAALASKTSSAFASLSTINQTTPLRSSPSASSLSRLSRLPSATVNPLTPPLSDGDSNPLLDLARSESPALADLNPSHKRRLTLQRIPTPPQEVRHFSATVPTAPPKMHQTSSRLLRMTEDERPFTKVS